jgi:hypothetical protein
MNAMAEALLKPIAANAPTTAGYRVTISGKATASQVNNRNGFTVCGGAVVAEADNALATPAADDAVATDQAEAADATAADQAEAAAAAQAAANVQAAVDAQAAADAAGSAALGASEARNHKTTAIVLVVVLTLVLGSIFGVYLIRNQTPDVAGLGSTGGSTGGGSGNAKQNPAFDGDAAERAVPPCHEA